MLLELLSRAVQHDWLMRMLTPAFGKWNPFTAAYRHDPYPVYARLQREAPRYKAGLLQSWVFTKHDDVTELLTHPHMSVARGESDLFKKYAPLEGASDRLQATLLRSLLMLDPPDHTRIRRLVNKAFTPGAVHGLAPRIELLAERHLAGVKRGERFDVLGGLAVPLPVIMICELLGVPTDRLAGIKRWSELLTGLLDPINAIHAIRSSQQALAELAAYFDGLFAARRREPRDDLLTALVQAEEEGDRLSGDELISLVALLLAAGHETTTNMIANSVLALEDEPGLRRRLVADPTCRERAVDELLRFDSPVQLTDRFATHDTTLGRGRDAVTIEKGVMAVMLLGAANHDPDLFPDPARIDFDRENLRHLSFGHGVHYCVGAALARLEGKLVLPRLFAALGDYEVERRGLDWKRSVVLRGPTQLVVKVGSGPRDPASSAGRAVA